MKRIVVIMFCLALALCFMVSCTSLVGVNYDKKTKELSIGMDKESVLGVIGESYSIESVSEEPEGYVEVLKFPDYNELGYFITFLDGKLTKIERNRTQSSKEKVVIEHKE